MAKKSDAQIGIRVSSGLKERLEAQARRILELAHKRRGIDV